MAPIFLRGDCNVDDAVDLADAVHILNFLFLGYREPAEPFPACGPDSTDDDLECVAYERCEER